MTEPEVSVPAVMRNYHEVLRNDLSKVLAPLAEAGDMVGIDRAHATSLTVAGARLWPEPGRFIRQAA